MEIALNQGRTPADVEKAVPHWRTSSTVRRIDEAREAQDEKQNVLVERHRAAVADRRKKQTVLEQLEAKGAPPAHIAAASRELIDGLAAESATRQALAESSASSVVDPAHRSAIESELQKTAAAIAKRNQAAGEPLVVALQAAVMEAAALNATNNVADMYFDGAHPAIGRVFGIRTYLPESTRLYPSLAGEVLRMLESWLRQARGEKLR